MSEQSDQIRLRFLLVQQQIETSLQKVQRAPGSVKLVVVTKGQAVDKIQALIEAGGHFLGENYPEETAQKIERLTGTQNIEWHMIGHIQSRKIKFLTQYFGVVESVESMETALKLSVRFLEAERTIRILLEVNVSGEASKQGFSVAEKQNWAALVERVNEIQELPALDLVGLMTMPPLGEIAESSRVYFKRLRELLDYVNAHKRGKTLTEVSMGTSFDYPVAVEEGATIVRIGEAIMGARNYA